MRGRLLGSGCRAAGAGGLPARAVSQRTRACVVVRARQTPVQRQPSSGLHAGFEPSSHCGDVTAPRGETRGAFDKTIIKYFVIDLSRGTATAGACQCMQRTRVRLKTQRQRLCPLSRRQDGPGAKLPDLAFSKTLADPCPRKCRLLPANTPVNTRYKLVPRALRRFDRRMSAAALSWCCLSPSRLRSATSASTARDDATRCTAPW